MCESNKLGVIFVFLKFGNISRNLRRHSRRCYSCKLTCALVGLSVEQSLMQRVVVSCIYSASIPQPQVIYLRGSGHYGCELLTLSYVSDIRFVFNRQMSRRVRSYSIGCRQTGTTVPRFNQIYLDKCLIFVQILRLCVDRQLTTPT